MSEFGNDAAVEAMRLMTDIIKDFLKYIVETRERRLQRELHKLQVETKKTQLTQTQKELYEKRKKEIVDKNRGYINLKKLLNSGEKIRMAATKMSLEDQKIFQHYAKIMGLSYSFVTDKKVLDELTESREKLKQIDIKAKAEGLTQEDVDLRDNLHERISELESRKHEKIIVIRDKDLPMLLDITNRMCAEIELQAVNTKIDSVVNDEIVTEKGNHYDCKETNLEDAVKGIFEREDITKPVYILDSQNPDTYIITSTQIQKPYNKERTDYISTTCTVVNNGVEQKSKEFAHGRFTRNTDFSGNNTTEAGNKHWQNMREEIATVSGFSGKAIVFSDGEQFESYRQEMREKIKENQVEISNLKENKKEIVEKNINDYNESLVEEQPQVWVKEDVVEDNSINFDRAVFAVTNKTGKMYIVDAVDPEKYIEANTSTHIEFDTNEGTSIYHKTVYTVMNHGLKQECSLMPDKEFVCASINDSNGASSNGDKWKSIKREMYEKSDFSDSLFVLSNKRMFERFQECFSEQMQTFQMYKNEVFNSTKEYQIGNEIFEFKNYNPLINHLKQQLNDNGYVISDNRLFDRSGNEVVKESPVLEQKVAYNQFEIIFNYEKTSELQNLAAMQIAEHNEQKIGSIKENFLNLEEQRTLLEKDLYKLKGIQAYKEVENREVNEVETPEKKGVRSQSEWEQEINKQKIQSRTEQKTHVKDNRDTDMMKSMTMEKERN